MKKVDDEELDKIIREVIGAERKVIFDIGNSPTKRIKEIKDIIERRAQEVMKNDPW